MNQKTVYSKLIKEEALKTGFDDCGISKAEYLEEDALYLRKWLDRNFNADMRYMSDNFEKRTNPLLLVENARSVISVILNYYPGHIQLNPASPVISKYAYGADYHFVMKKKLEKLLNFVQKLIPGTQGRAFVDSAPVLEHAWAKRAGIGWTGKNSLLLTPGFGSFVFIGELIVSAELAYNTPIKERCGSCRKCIEACPTGAIVDEKIIDARKCISYHTIENKGDISSSLHGKFKNRIFGCDICQDVCPWNQKAVKHKTEEFNPHPKLLQMSKEDWHELNENEFNEIFVNSAIRRTGFKRLKRNLAFIS